MAQILKQNRLDNRGGNKPKGTKKMFTYRVEEKHHELLKEIAIYLNNIHTLHSHN